MKSFSKVPASTNNLASRFLINELNPDVLTTLPPLNVRTAFVPLLSITYQEFSPLPLRVPASLERVKAYFVEFCTLKKLYSFWDTCYNLFND